MCCELPSAWMILRLNYPFLEDWHVPPIAHPSSLVSKSLLPFQQSVRSREPASTRTCREFYKCGPRIQRRNTTVQLSWDQSSENFCAVFTTITVCARSRSVFRSILDVEMRTLKMSRSWLKKGFGHLNLERHPSSWVPRGNDWVVRMKKARSALIDGIAKDEDRSKQSVRAGSALVP